MTKSRVSEFKVNPEKIMKRLGRMLEQSKHEPDEDFFYDRMYFMKNSYRYNIRTFMVGYENKRETAWINRKLSGWTSKHEELLPPHMPHSSSTRSPPHVPAQSCLQSLELSASQTPHTS